MAINQILSRSKTCLYHQIDLLLLLIRLPAPYETVVHILLSREQKKGQGVSRTKYGEEALPIGRKNTQHAKK